MRLLFCTSRSLSASITDTILIDLGSVYNKLTAFWLGQPHDAAPEASMSRTCCKLRQNTCTSRISTLRTKSPEPKRPTQEEQEENAVTPRHLGFIGEGHA